MSRESRVELFRIGRDQAVRIPYEFELPGEHAMLSSHCREKRFSKLILDYRLSKDICDSARNGRVEEGRGGLAEWPSPPVSLLRSSNRTCGFPASGFPTGFIVRPTAVIQRQNPEFPKDHCRWRIVAFRGWGPCVASRGSVLRVRRRDDRRPCRPCRG
jgi:hypothetical protein